MDQTKKPCRGRAFSLTAELFLGADEFDVNTAIGLQALDNLLALRTLALTGLGHRLLAALAFGVNTVGRDALGDQIILDGGGALLGQFLVVGSATDTVSVTNSNDNFQVQLLGLANDVIQLGLAFGAQRCLVEVEQRVSSNGDFLTESGFLGRFLLRLSLHRSRLRLADFLGDQILVALAAVLVLGGGSRCPEPGTLVQAERIHDDFATAVNCVDAVGLSLCKRSTEANGCGQEGHYDCFFHLIFLIS